MHAAKVALVTGSSSGMGFETALLLARSGFYTYASMRNLEKSKNNTNSQYGKIALASCSARCH
jgi:NAD(P)-dependent dehydrogenase (short-subunit alcohol dehydrogenase family)